MTDHEGIHAQFRTKNNKNGPGIWKFPSELLENKRFMEDFKSFWQEFRNTKNEFQFLTQWWDYGKLYIKCLAQKHQKLAIRTDQVEINKLNQKINHESTRPTPDHAHIDQLKGQRQIIQRRLDGEVKAEEDYQKFSEDEKPTKFFYSTLKEHQQRTTLTKLNTNTEENPVYIENFSEILEKSREFYEKLYTAQNELDVNYQEAFLSKTRKKISAESYRLLEEPLTLEELKKARFKMANNMPGKDGLTSEFYKAVWNDIQDDFLEVVQDIHQLQNLPTSQKSALITLILKEDQNPEFLNSYRPITLLGVDYKIITKALANKLQKVLHEIIEPDQTCGIPGRTIMHNCTLL